LCTSSTTVLEADSLRDVGGTSARSLRSLVASSALGCPCRLAGAVLLVIVVARSDVAAVQVQLIKEVHLAVGGLLRRAPTALVEGLVPLRSSARVRRLGGVVQLQHRFGPRAAPREVRHRVRVFLGQVLADRVDCALEAGPAPVPKSSDWRQNRSVSERTPASCRGGSRRGHRGDHQASHVWLGTLVIDAQRPEQRCAQLQVVREQRRERVLVVGHLPGNHGGADPAAGRAQHGHGHGQPEGSQATGNRVALLEQRRVDDAQASWGLAGGPYGHLLNHFRGRQRGVPAGLIVVDAAAALGLAGENRPVGRTGQDDVDDDGLAEPPNTGTSIL